jgi:ribosomal protein S18 acetylase RimI-like enzyme
MNIQIRQGNEDDIEDVYRLVGMLADFHDAPDEFVTRVADYRRDFADGFFKVIVAEDVDKKLIVGMALYTFMYSTWKGRELYLEDFVLDPDYRRLGIGQRLWDVLKQRGIERGCKIMKWQVDTDNAGGLKFYEAQGATISDNWVNGTLELTEAQQ